VCVCVCVCVCQHTGHKLVLLVYVRACHTAIIHRKTLFLHGLQLRSLTCAPHRGEVSAVFFAVTNAQGHGRHHKKKFERVFLLFKVKALTNLWALWSDLLTTNYNNYMPKGTCDVKIITNFNILTTRCGQLHCLRSTPLHSKAIHVVMCAPA